AADGPRVIDFGVARALDGTSLTTTGVTFGTPSYMSPEQGTGDPLGPASDVFALGSVLCFAATGGVPFGDGDAPSVLYRVIYSPPALDAVPAGLRDLVAACLVKNPAERPTLPQLLRACQAVTGFELTRSGGAADAARTGKPTRLAWSHQTGGPVTSGAAVAGGVACIGSDDGHIYAFRAASGHLIRKIPVGGAVSAPVT